MQLVDALNKAVANGDRESMFRRADELEQSRAVIPHVSWRERYGHRASLIRLDKSLGISRWRITRQTTCNFRFAGVLLYEWSLRSSECLWNPSGCRTCSLGKVQSVALYDCIFNKPLPLVGLSARISKMAG